jgi:uncharacterized protein YqjF (DUF2071 family)
LKSDRGHLVRLSAEREIVFKSDSSEGIKRTPPAGGQDVRAPRVTAGHNQESADNLMNHEPSIADRLSIRSRPNGVPLMHQHWGKLLFMHWPIDAELLRPLIPSQLSIDTFDGSAWIGEIPFTMWGIRASFLPPVPGASAFHELNVRTYVHCNCVPGVWFFSLDAANSLAVWGARTFYHLPYFNADMSLTEHDTTIEYSSRRTDKLTYGEFFAAEAGEISGAANAEQFRESPRAGLNASWTIGEPLPQSSPGSIEFFLTERYCLYSYYRIQLYRSRIFHEPWPLRRARLNSRQSTMIQSLGIAEPKEQPLLHYAEAIAVDIWPLKRVSEARP